MDHITKNDIEVKGKNIELLLNSSNSIKIITNVITGEKLNIKGKLYDIDNVNIQGKLSFSITPEGKVKIDLRLINNSPTTENVKVTFPNINIENNSEIGYCFPRLQPAIGVKNDKMRNLYGSEFPLQFINIYKEDKGSFTFITQDLCNREKCYWLDKNDNDILFGVDYNGLQLEPYTEMDVPSILIEAHQGDWHDGLLMYREWVKTWHNYTENNTKWLNEIFHFRQHFIHNNYGDKALTDNNKYVFHELIDCDKEAFGGIDFIQMFDWGYSPENGRVGDYIPWKHIDKDELKNEIGKIKEKGIRVGAYFEGYLINRHSKIGMEYGEKWCTKNENGHENGWMDETYWHVCPSNEQWQSYLINKIEQVYKDLKFDSVYIDEYGLGHNRICYDRTHNHKVPCHFYEGEISFLKKLRERLPKNVAILTEYCPTDVTTQYQSASLTYCKDKINLTRFALPFFKNFVIISCDEPIGPNLKYYKNVFFNGMGIWLAGPTRNKIDILWFPQNVRKFLKKTYLIQKKHSDAFSTLEPMPLIKTTNEGILVNEFPIHNKVVWTIYNDSTKEHKGILFSCKYSEGSRFYDEWSEEEITPYVVNGRYQLDVTIKPQGIGCIVQYKK